MTDLEILKHAQEYIAKLSQGINPLTDELAAENVQCILQPATAEARSL
ncbi:MAG: hypothetical protein ACI4XA_02590 [Oscillospiraceae bacterium]